MPNRYVKLPYLIADGSHLQTFDFKLHCTCSSQIFRRSKIFAGSVSAHCKLQKFSKTIRRKSISTKQFFHLIFSYFCCIPQHITQWTSITSIKKLKLEQKANLSILTLFILRFFPLSAWIEETVQITPPFVFPNV